MPILADYHLHTHHSGDSKAPMEAMINEAVQRGLKEICFTDHMDLDYPDCYDLLADPFTLDIPAYKKELLKYKEQYASDITVKYGIEIGMQKSCLEANKSIVRSNDFDFVIASIHLVDGLDPYYESFWKGDTIENIYKRYFDVTLENITLFSDFDVLGHLDYMARYVFPKDDTTYSYERFSDRIDEILRFLAANGKGLDINSKVLASDPNGIPNPCPEALKRFKELGGQIITFGSDAHAPAGIAAGFVRLRDIALSCGFTEYYTFEKRTPVAHKLYSD